MILGLCKTMIENITVENFATFLLGFFAGGIWTFLILNSLLGRLSAQNSASEEIKDKEEKSVKKAKKILNKILNRKRKVEYVSSLTEEEIKEQDKSKEERRFFGDFAPPVDESEKHEL